MPKGKRFGRTELICREKISLECRVMKKTVLGEAPMSMDQRRRFFAVQESWEKVVSSCFMSEERTLIEKVKRGARRIPSLSITKGISREGKGGNCLREGGEGKRRR